VPLVTCLRNHTVEPIAINVMTYNINPGYLSDSEEEKSETVLFVSGEEYALGPVERLLSESNILFLKAGNAREALDIIKRQEIAVVVSDSHMPGIKGIDLLAKVNNTSPETLKILMTTDADLMTAVNAINKGEVSRVIVKPWVEDYLFQNIKEVIIQYRISRSLKRENRATLLSIAQAVELKDLYTLGHCNRVTKYSLQLAHAAGVSLEIIKDLRYGSSLHDFGKIHIPEHVLNKKGPLTNEEYNIMKNHPAWGANVARHIKLSQQIINIIFCHHERYDGMGYPTGLKRHDIPLEARIVTMADIYDALTTDRPYRRKYSKDAAVNIMKSMKGNILDPELLDVFLNKCLKSNKDQVSPALDQSFNYSGQALTSFKDSFSQYASIKNSLKQTVLFHDLKLL
jgi:putative two-component system response regulator